MQMQGSTNARRKVLIAEDYADMRAMTRIMVEAIGFDVIEASDGAEAIEQAKENMPDAVLMDIAMPILNGITAATMIHQLEGLEDVPIIALTAYGKEYVGNAGLYGFDAVIQKPIGIEDLKRVLEKQLDAEIVQGDRSGLGSRGH
jgi:CheY-like chemotaxis protein